MTAHTEQPMTPEEAEVLIPLYVLGELALDQQQALLAFVETDAACRRQFEQMTQTYSVLADALQAGPESELIDPEAYARLLADSDSARPRWGGVKVQLLQILAVAAIVCLLMYLAIPAFDMGESQDARVPSAANMKGTGLSLVMSEATEGAPRAVVSTGYLDSTKQKVWGAPRAVGSTLSASRPQFSVDYIYAGSGVKAPNKSPTTAILAYDEEGSAPDDGWTDALDVDGQVTGEASDSSAKKPKYFFSGGGVRGVPVEEEKGSRNIDRRSPKKNKEHRSKREREEHGARLAGASDIMFRESSLSLSDSITVSGNIDVDANYEYGAIAAAVDVAGYVGDKQDSLADVESLSEISRLTVRDVSTIESFSRRLDSGDARQAAAGGSNTIELDNFDSVVSLPGGGTATGSIGGLGSRWDALEGDNQEIGGRSNFGRQVELGTESDGKAKGESYRGDVRFLGAASEVATFNQRGSKDVAVAGQAAPRSGNGVPGPQGPQGKLRLVAGPAKTAPLPLASAKAIVKNAVELPRSRPQASRGPEGERTLRSELQWTTEKWVAPGRAIKESTVHGGVVWGELDDGRDSAGDDMVVFNRITPPQVMDTVTLNTFSLAASVFGESAETEIIDRAQTYGDAFKARERAEKKRRGEQARQRELLLFDDLRESRRSEAGEKKRERNRVELQKVEIAVYEDTRAPVIDVPADIFVNGDVDPGANLEQVITRTWTGADDCGNSSDATQTIIVVDNFGSATATDNCDLEITLSNEVVDVDDDGLSNFYEYLARTNPDGDEIRVSFSNDVFIDNEDDGISDQWEMSFTDSDEDGFADASGRRQSVMTNGRARDGYVQKQKRAKGPQRIAPEKQALKAIAQMTFLPVQDDKPIVDDAPLPPPPPRPPGPVNPWVMTTSDKFSTFALEADTASYTLARRYIRRGYLPPPGVVRMEEFINAFDYNYVAQDDQTFTVQTTAAPSPFGRDVALLKIGVRGKVVGRDDRKAAHLVFVVDASGSMARRDRIPLVKRALMMVTNQLDARDRVTLVTYGTRSQLVLEAVPATAKQRIFNAVNNIECGNATNMLAGIATAYSLASRHFKSGQVNRIVLCSDGVANMGPAEAEEILSIVKQYREHGVTFTSVGVGAGAYDDRMMEQLANKGDGNYFYIDSLAEAQRVFVDNFSSTFQTIAKDVKIQVEFNPDRVRRYRLIGYENRDIADKDFRNDKVDAGEIGSGQSATALYEIELHDGAATADIGTVYVRYKEIGEEAAVEFASRLPHDIVQPRVPEQYPRFFLAACAAEFAELLRQSEHASDGSIAAVEQIMIKVANALPLDRSVADLLRLTEQAQGLPVYGK